MKILLLTPGDPNNHKAWSGTVNRIFEILKSLGHDVKWHGRLPRASVSLRFYILLVKIFTGKKYQWKLSIPHSKRMAKIISRRVTLDEFDIIFVVAGATESAFVSTKTPMIYLSDATFNAMANYAPGFSNLSERSLQEGDFLEQRVLNRANYIIYSSDWAKDSAVNFYKIKKSKISVLKFGPHLNRLPMKKDLSFQYDNSKIKLLFIGNNWKRKGGAVAVDTFNELKSRGLKVTLTIVGCNPKMETNNDITIIPFLNKNNPEQFLTLCNLYIASTFFILPTLNEAAGIVFSESAAFGLPAISYDTGGVSSYIDSGITGELLPEDSTGIKFADSIENILSEPLRYEKMCSASREKFETELNWDIWKSGCSEIIEKCKIERLSNV